MTADTEEQQINTALDALITAARQQGREEERDEDKTKEAQAQTQRRTASDEATSVVHDVSQVDSRQRVVEFAQAWLSRQIVTDNREPMLDEGDCRFCGLPGECHEMTEPCGIVASLLKTVTAAEAERDALRAQLAALSIDDESNDGIRFDPETKTWIARHTIITAAQDEATAHLALAEAVQLTAEHWPRKRHDLKMR